MITKFEFLDKVIRVDELSLVLLGGWQEIAYLKHNILPIEMDGRCIKRMEDIEKQLFKRSVELDKLPDSYKLELDKHLMQLWGRK